MSEFGHHHAAFKKGRLDYWGSGPFVIEASGQSWRFEDSDRFGPALVKQNGDIKAEPRPSESSPFWRAHRIWVRQGRRLEGNKCIWDEPKPTKLRRINKRNALIVEAGEEDGIEIWLDAEPPK